MEKISKKTNKRLIVGVSSVILMAPLLANSAVESWLGTATTASASTTKLNQVNAAARKAFAPERKVNQLIHSSMSQSQKVPVLNVTVRASAQNNVKKGERIVYRFNTKNVSLANLQASSSKGLPFSYRKVNNHELQLTFKRALKSGSYTQAFAIPTKNVTSITKVMASFDDHVLAIGHNKVPSTYTAPKVVQTTTQSSQTQVSQQATVSQPTAFTTQTSASAVTHDATQTGTTEQTTKVAQPQQPAAKETTASSNVAAPANGVGHATVAKHYVASKQVSATDAYNAVMDRTTVDVDGQSDTTGSTTQSAATSDATASANATNAATDVSTTGEANTSSTQTANATTGSQSQETATNGVAQAASTSDSEVATVVPEQTVNTPKETLKQYIDQSGTDTTDQSGNETQSTTTASSEQTVTPTTGTSTQEAVGTDVAKSTTPTVNGSTTKSTTTDTTQDSDSLSNQGEALFEGIRSQVADKTPSASEIEQAEITKALPWIWQNVAQKTSDSLKSTGRIWQYSLQLSTGRMARITIDGRSTSSDTASLDANMPALLKSLGDQSTPGMFDAAVDLDVLKDSSLYQTLQEVQSVNTNGGNTLLNTLGIWLKHPNDMGSLMTILNPSKATTFELTSGLITLGTTVLQPIFMITSALMPIIIGVTAAVGVIVTATGLALGSALAGAGLVIGAAIAVLSILPITLATVFMITHPVILFAAAAIAAITVVAVAAIAAAVVAVSAAIIASISVMVAVPVALGIMSLLALPVLMTGHWLSDLTKVTLPTNLASTLGSTWTGFAPVVNNFVGLGNNVVSLGNGITTLTPATFGISDAFVAATLPGVTATIPAGLASAALFSALFAQLGKGSLMNMGSVNGLFGNLVDVAAAIVTALTPGVAMPAAFNAKTVAEIGFMLIALVPLAAFVLKRMLAASRQMSTMAQLMSHLLAKGQPALSKARLVESAILASIRKAGSLLAMKYGPLGIKVMVGNTLLRVICLAMVVFGLPFKAVRLFNRLLSHTVFGTVNVLTDLIGIAVSGMTNTLHQVHNMIADAVAVEVAAAGLGDQLTANVKYLMANLLGSLNQSLGEISTLTLAVTYLFAHTVQGQNQVALMENIAALVIFIFLVTLAALAWRRFKWTSMLARQLTSYLGVSGRNVRQIHLNRSNTSSMGLSSVIFGMATSDATSVANGQATTLSLGLATSSLVVVGNSKRKNIIAPLNNSLA